MSAFKGEKSIMIYRVLPGAEEKDHLSDDILRKAMKATSVLRCER